MICRTNKIILLLVVSLIPLLVHAKDGFTPVGNCAITNTDSIIWSKLQLPPAPQDTSDINLGLAGVFAGKVRERIVIAGGANFPNGPVSDGGAKHWWADIYTYNEVEGWRYFPNALPQPLAYGCSFELQEGLICIGGCNEDGCSDNVFLIGLDESGVPYVNCWPSLPYPLSYMSGGKIGNKLYLAGGIKSAQDNESLDSFICLDLNAKDSGWNELPSWPGPDRAFSVSSVQSDGLDNCLYLFSGRSVKGSAPWRVLKDGYKYNPRLNEWTEIGEDFTVMACSATSLGTNHILFLSNPLMTYHTVTGRIETFDSGLKLPVTSAVVRDGDDILVCSGEVAPYVRTPDIVKGTLTSRIKSIGWLDSVVIFIYFALLACIGWFFSRRQKTIDDYFKGGGRIPWFIAGLSIFGTALSAITFMSIPAKAYATDWSYLVFNAGIVIVVPIIVLLFIPFYRRLGVTTAYEYLEKRFSPLVRVICSVSFIIFQIGRMGVVMLLPAIALNVVTGFSIPICVVLMGLFALVYTYMGGIEAVAWTDAIQVVVLVGAAVAVVVSVCISTEGGMSGVVSTACSDSKFSLGSFEFDLKQATIWTTLIATCFTNLTSYGTDQTIVQRYLTTATETEAKKGVYTNAILCIPATLLFFFVGTCLYVFFKNNPLDLSASLSSQDAILPWYVNMKLPAGVVGLVIAGLFAAAMSTLSASMNSAATAYVVDIFSKIDRSGSSDLLKTAKLATLAIGAVGVVFALLMATWDIKSLWDEFSKILGLLLSGLGGLFLLGLTSKKANVTGALCGLTGCIAVQLAVMQFHAVYLLLYSTVGFVSCYVIGLVVSMMTGGCKKDINGLTIF